MDHANVTQHRPLIYLADLTHTGQIIASNVAPLGIGVIASYMKQQPDVDVDIELFKYPKDLNEALLRRMPQIIGFANYSWNCEIAYKFAARVKDVSPETVVIFGGPNYGLTEEEMHDFWAHHPRIDFYIVKEGEVAFLELFRALSANGYDAQALRDAPTPPKNCHFIVDGRLVTGELLPRIKDLDELGSPYLLGLMDKFFDGVLIPMIHTTRGCPFTCAFCTEGNPYYSKVAQKFDLRDELTYIADRRKSVHDLVITDANFGMFKEDADKARILADIQTKYDWPRRILVSTGKNQKERVIEVAGILGGAIAIAASLQSTNEAVLKNIKRSNISAEALRTIVEKSTEADSPTYTELILALPGDTVESHVQSLRDVVNAGLGIVRMYQLILLPQTELNTPETRKKFGMQTRFRINPRSFGRYPVLGEVVCAIEAEEIVVQTDTLSYDEYFSCRELDLTVEIIHNTGMFVELMGLCRWLDYPWFDFVHGFYETRRQHGPRLTALYDTFTADSQKRLWPSREAVERDVEERMDAYLNDPYGTNEMAVSKAIAFFQLQDELHDVLFDRVKVVLEGAGKTAEAYNLYVQELKQYSRLRKKDFLDTDVDYTAEFHFDFSALKKVGFAADPREYQLDEAIEARFHHSPEQKKTMGSYVLQYGKTVDGLGRILMRAPVKSLFRDIEVGRNRTSGLSMESFG